MSNATLLKTPLDCFGPLGFLVVGFVKPLTLVVGLSYWLWALPLLVVGLPFTMGVVMGFVLFYVIFLSHA
jgi:hypothetical protein